MNMEQTEKKQHVLFSQPFFVVALLVCVWFFVFPDFVGVFGVLGWFPVLPVGVVPLREFVNVLVPELAPFLPAGWPTTSDA